MFVTDYLEEFHCIGSACEDSCCTGWQVTIDKASFKRYQKINNPELKDLLSKQLKRTKGVNRSEVAFATVKLDSQGACPILDQDGLCQIHCAMGEKALSQTCRSYPRILNKVDGMIEGSAKLSCPEVARLALLRPGGINFLESSMEIDGLSLLNSVNTSTKPSKQPQHYLWQLQLHAIETLKNRQLPLWKRLMMLGLVYRKLDESDQPLSDHLINDTIQTYQSLMHQTDYNQALDKLQFSSDVMISMVAQFIELRSTLGFGNRRFLECHDEAMKYLTNNQDESVNVCQRYEAAFREHFGPFLEQYDYILENYLVNYAFQNLLPTHPSKQLFDNFMSMVINYATIRLYLVGIAGQKGAEFAPQDAVKLIQSFTKVVEHSSSFIENIRQLFITKGQNGMAHMSLLLKDPSMITKTKTIKNVLELESA